MESLVEKALEIARREGEIPSRRRLQKELSISESSAREIRAVVKYILQKENEGKYKDIDEINPVDVIDLPRPIEENHRKPYRLTGYRRIGIISDVHFPYHDYTALKTALKKLYEYEIDTLILNGDIVDFYSVSFWEKKPDRRNLQRERELAVKALEKIREIFRDVKIIFKEGNHEERLGRWLSRKAPELYEIEELQVDNFLKLKDLNIAYVKDKRRIEVGELDIIHGHEYRSLASVNIAISFLRKAFKNVLLGHFHRKQEDTKKTIRDELTGCWVVGCLCFSEDTEVLTKDGFKSFKDVTEDDLIANYDPQTQEIFYTPYIAKQILYYEGEMINIIGAGLDMLVTPDHIILYKDHNNKLKVRPAGQFKRGYHIPVAGFNKGITQVNKDIFALLGWIIAEGSYDGHSISIYQKHTEYEREIEALLQRLGIKFGAYKDKRNGVMRFKISAQDTRDILSYFDNGNIKQIPRVLLSSDYKTLKILYEVLIKADGHRNKGGSDYFATKHLDLALQFQKLCLKIGYSCIVKKELRDTNLKPNSVIYLCRVRKRMFRTVKEIKRVKYKGFVYDLTVPSHYLICRRNNTIFISHNCDLKPDYAPNNEWTHGFAFIELFENGHFQVRNHLIQGEEVF